MVARNRQGRAAGFHPEHEKQAPEKGFPSHGETGENLHPAHGVEIGGVEEMARKATPNIVIPKEHVGQGLIDQQAWSGEQPEGNQAGQHDQGRKGPRSTENRCPKW